MLLSDGSQEFGKNLRMFCRHIMVFVDIGSQIIEPQKDFQISLKALTVELRGFEPLTLSMPWRCATSCAIAPWS